MKKKNNVKKKERRKKKRPIGIETKVVKWEKLRKGRKH